MPDPSYYGLRLLAELLVALFIKGFAKLLALMHAHPRWAEPSPNNGSVSSLASADFLNAPISSVWRVLVSSFGTTSDDVRVVHLQAHGRGWDITVLTRASTFVASVDPDGAHISVSKRPASGSESG